MMIVTPDASVWSIRSLQQCALQRGLFRMHLSSNWMQGTARRKRRCRSAARVELEGPHRPPLPAVLDKQEVGLFI